MLIIFHCVAIFFQYLYRSRKKLKSAKNLEEQQKQFLEVIKNDNVHMDSEYQLRFDPPVYKQRYGRVYNILLDEKWRKDIRKIVEFGCAEFSLFVFIKRLIGVSEIIFVDIDEDLLKHNLFKLNPLTIDYLKRRSEPLNVSIFAGSVSDPDYRLLKTDAVVAIELIEHLYPDALDKFAYNIFSYIEPKIAIVTTPNADFNVVIPNFKGTRHDDHKFEWTREQFEDWANNLVLRYPDYSVTFEGIGEGPKGTECFGFCSQMALFVRKDVINENHVPSIYTETCLCDLHSPCRGFKLNCKLECPCLCSLCCPKASHGVCTYHSYSNQILSYEVEENEINPSFNIYYKYVEKIEYPFELDYRTEEEKLMEEFRYRIYTMGHVNGRFYDYETNRCEIPLSDLLYGPDGAFITETELITLLKKFNYTVEECKILETEETKYCVIYEPEMEESSYSEASGYDSDSDYTQNINYQLTDECYSDWDEPDDKKGESYKSNKDASSSGSTSAPYQNDEDKKTQNSNLDSGYHKSASRIDDSPNTTTTEDLVTYEAPIPNTSTAVEPKFKRSVSSGHKSHNPHNAIVPMAPIPTSFIPLKIDYDKVNELDSLCNQNQFYHFPSSRTFNNQFVKKEMKRKHDVKEPVPGPSNVKRKKKVKKVESFDSDDDSSLDDVKSITNCLLENTLNKINVDKPIDSSKIITTIRENSVINLGNVCSIVMLPEASTDQNVTPSTDQPQPVIAPVVNDNEINSESDNVQNSLQISSIPLSELLNSLDVSQSVETIRTDVDSGMFQDAEVARASREALMDPDSVVDLLEDFEIPPPMQEAVPAPSNNDNFILIGVRAATDNQDAALVTVQNNGFPDWLLQLLGAEVDEINQSHDEPHFYCQGDGLGVHPSVIAIAVEEEDEASSEASTNHSADYAELENGINSNTEQEAASITEDLHTANVHSSENVDNNQNAARVATPESDEYFDPSSNLDSMTGHSSQNPDHL